MKRHIPNFITLCNLMAGSVGIVMVLTDQPRTAIVLILAAAMFDFMDGFSARLLKATSEIGKQLDSLADIVSFGLLPSAFIYKILQYQFGLLPEDDFWSGNAISMFILLSVLIVPVFSAIRLGRFNLLADSGSFIGLPTPAHALFWTGIYADVIINGSLFGQDIYVWFTWIIMVVLSVMMIAPVSMISMKFHGSGLRSNFYNYLMLLCGALVIILMGIPGLPVVILLYILLSLVRIILT